MRERSVTLLLLLAGILLFPSTTASQANGSSATADPAFGLIESHDAPQAATDLGVGFTRAKFHWAEIQPNSPLEWLTPDMDDQELADEIAAGREVIGLLIGLPSWAVDEQGLPEGLHLDHDDPGNTWASFVSKVMTRYKGKITHWIIWNEPDIWDETHPAHTWPGSEVDFVALLRTASLVAEEIDPVIQIHLPAMTHWWDASYDRDLYFNRLLRAIVEDPKAREHDYYYDVATMHVYFDPSSTFTLIQEYQRIQASYGIEKPFWLVETNAAPSNDALRPVTDITFHLSLTEQAAYIPQALSLALAAGAERVAIYKASDTPGDWVANPEPFGLLREDSSRRPVYVTAKIAIEQLSGFDSAIWRDSQMVSQVIVRKGSHVLRIIWSRVPSSLDVQLPLVSPHPILLDMWGNELPMEQDGETIALTLPAGECQETVSDYCMIGGPVYYLVDELPNTEITDDSLWITALTGTPPVPGTAPSVAGQWLMTALSLLIFLSLIAYAGILIANRLLEVQDDRA